MKIIWVALSTIMFYSFEAVKAAEDLSDEEMHTYCHQQIRHFCETLPGYVGNPLSSLLRDIVFTHDGDIHGWGIDCIKWLVNCGAYVDIKAWPSIIEACQTNQVNGYLSNKIGLLQALCARSNPDEQHQLLEMLSTLPKWHAFSVTHLLPLASNDVVASWLPHIKKHYKNPFCVLKHIMERQDNRLALYIKGEISTNEVWRSCMREQWVRKATHDQAKRRIFSSPPRIMGLPTNDP